MRSSSWRRPICGSAPARGKDTGATRPSPGDPRSPHRAPLQGRGGARSHARSRFACAASVVMLAVFARAGRFFARPLCRLSQACYVFNSRPAASVDRRHMSLSCRPNRHRGFCRVVQLHYPRRAPPGAPDEVGRHTRRRSPKGPYPTRKTLFGHRRAAHTILRRAASAAAGEERQLLSIHSPPARRMSRQPAAHVGAPRRARRWPK